MEVIMYCPYCNDHTGHLYYNPEKNVWHCFKCGKAGRGKPEGTVKFERHTKVVPGVIMMPPSSIPLADRPKDIQSQRAYQYLRNRGLTREEICQYRVHRSGSYVVFPLHDGEGHLRYWVARAFTKLNRRYLNCPGSKDKVIFTTHPPMPGGFLVEGIFTAIMIGRAFPAVAILGKEMTDGQRDRIKAFFKKWVVVLLDDDAVDYGMKIWDKFRGERICRQEYFSGDLDFITERQLAQMVRRIRHAYL